MSSDPLPSSPRCCHIGQCIPWTCLRLVPVLPPPWNAFRFFLVIQASAEMSLPLRAPAWPSVHNDHSLVTLCLAYCHHGSSQQLKLPAFPLFFSLKCFLEISICPLLLPQSLAHCLVKSRCLINICWKNECVFLTLSLTCYGAWESSLNSVFFPAGKWGLCHLSYLHSRSVMDSMGEMKEI